jgi:hypothetical protein
MSSLGGEFSIAVIEEFTIAAHIMELICPRNESTKRLSGFMELFCPRSESTKLLALWSSI